LAAVPQQLVSAPPGAADTAANTATASSANEDTEVGHKNTVRQCVDEICNTLLESHEIREEVKARGVEFHALNMMIELGVNDKPDQLNDVIATSLAASKKAHGSKAISEEQLREHLDTLVVLEKDVGHVRQLARSQKLNMQALNFLTQTIRVNPGDGGEKTINDLVAYAMLCDIKLERFADIAEGIGGDTKSVLPEIDFDEEDERLAARKRLIKDVILGLVIGGGIFWLFL